ncbi:MAG: sulfite exporter TauE/SafE family protein, partial [Lachnospiraceae bacterium]|nr:sulfite exporter TauE/SafE family protein [Lachnospiraceae bacterium]
KTAAENSLYTILFSQIASVLYSIISGNVPEFSLGMLILMVGSGICGGIFGRGFNKKLESKMVDRLFVGLMIVMIFINIYNIYKFM